jgi:hypothetical protein
MESQLKDPGRTFQWIVSVLQKHDVPFVVTGGLAAKSYGSLRTLNDIDIDIPSGNFIRILPDIKPYVVFGPSRYLDEKWDLPLMTLEHYGQEIDIGGGDETKIYDNRSKKWTLIPAGFLEAEQREIFRLVVPVVPPHQLIAYKSLLNGEHQKVDIQAAESFLKSRA